MLTPKREQEIRDRLRVVISHIEADMAADLLEALDDLRFRIRGFALENEFSTKFISSDPPEDCL